MHEPINERERYNKSDKSADSGQPGASAGSGDPGRRSVPEARSPLDRRAVLGTTGALGAGLALGSGYGPAMAADRTGVPLDAQATATAKEKPPTTQAAHAALKRLLPQHADQITLQQIGGPERFKVTGRAGRIQVAGTGPVALLMGVHWYLKYSCDAHISWAGSRLDLPATLPAPRKQHAQRATVPNRFALNDTHDGYTAPYADWGHWERFLDILALHGFNEVLVTAGQEAVYHRMLQDFGYSDKEARSWIPAPTHQPWWLLQNMAEYGGPISTELLNRRTTLGKLIVGRMRELGMKPVLPGYFGTVPTDFAKRNRGGRTIAQGKWGGLERPPWLDPRTAVFRKVAASFYKHQRQLFGEVDHFKMDLLHEGGNPGDVPVPKAARAVEKALHTARPGATWVILGWQENPRRDLLDGLAAKHKMLIVDGLSDLDRVTNREKDWGGVPYAFGTIPNFGGRTTMGARTHMWTERFTAWRDKRGSKLNGTCYMPEATHRDAAALELFSELAWRQRAVDRGTWFNTWAKIRYGGADAQAKKAMTALRETAYRINSKDGRPHDSIFAARPSLTARSGAYYATHTPAFDLPAFDAAFSALLGVAAPLRETDAYRYDLTETGRQILANRSWSLIPQLQAAYKKKDAATFKKLSALWLKLMELADEMSGGHRAFLLGPWLAAARDSGASGQERAELERTARVLITTWADRPSADGGHLANYANRDWQGLIRDFHLPQWKAFLDDLLDALEQHRAPKKFDWYALEEPWTKKTNDYSTRPLTDPYKTATRIRDVLVKAPYQGSLKVSAEPRAVPPGKASTLRAVFRNENGLSPTGAVDLALHGLKNAKAQDPTSHRAVSPGGTATVRWRFTTPDQQPAQPLEPLEYTVEAENGPEGQERVTTVEAGRIYRAGPLPDGVRTATTNDAVFGHLEGRWALDGAGADLWKATAEFGTVYRPQALNDSGTVTLKVVSQEESGPWARAGIVVRNNLAEPASAGFVNLAVTPGNGVVLSYDSNGDGTLDTYRSVSGVRAPVLLRLSRSGTSYKGELSTDDGKSWRTVSTVEVPGASGKQDAGAFMSATNGGSGDRALVEFADWQTG